MTTRARLITYRLSLMATDALLSAGSFYVAFSLRTDQFPLGPVWTKAFVQMLPFILALRLLALYGFGVYRIMVRYTSSSDALLLAYSTFVSTALILVYAMFVHWSRIPNTVVVIDGFINFIAVAMSRFGYRMFYDARGGTLFVRPSKRRRVLIVGAGRRGAALAREVRRRAHEGLVLIGFIDDDPAKQNQLIQGAPVLGTSQEAPEIIATHKVDEAIIAISAAKGFQVREITRRLESVPVRLRISPGFAELDESELLTHLRDVEVEDLLQREPVSVDVEEIAAYLSGARVLITGAGGSIGSELVRQISLAGPEELILLGHGENSVFEIEEEMRTRLNGLSAGRRVPRLTCVIADIRDYDRVLRVMKETAPTVVFHAAAHKHVPLMELNPEEAITNNVLGTRNLARAASLVGVRRFVMISTDKAVNPTSIMGASKRVAERVIQAESARSQTDFAMVRFGNVLGSRGSVVPVMKRQIERGGPVTVTHPDVTRYFMTIPEAVQLVIQAGAMGGNGTIYVLDMGEPVKIMDLAHSLIRLSGLIPDRDIKIVITGLRPGEKLHEELLTDEEGTSLTKHARIFVAAQTPAPVEDVDYHLDALIEAAQTGDHARMLAELTLLAPSYTCGGIVAGVSAREHELEDTHVHTGK
ncbi:MAG: polysaccharide biosynthesis protein [Chthonomonadales bacterium]|nr:polysaccharide biosynthesis protein [Chthonomonadales bacterium]